MAKKSYNIPTSLDKSYLDMKINLQTKGGMGAKPLSLSLLATSVFSMMLLFLVLTKTFMNRSHIITQVLFGILWVALTALLLKRDETHLPQYSLVTTMLNYLPKQYRYIVTRKSARPNAFYKIVGIDYIDLDKGLLYFADGSFGYIYQVVGSASTLLFEADRDAILDRVDKFWRKIKTDSEWMFVTIKEPQKVYKQVGHLKYRYDNLDVPDVELRGLLDAQYKVLTETIGQDFRTMHQYLILKAKNKEALIIAKNILQDEVENSAYMFKQCTAMFDQELLDVLSNIYKGKESI